MKKLGEIIGKFVVKHKILIVIASVILFVFHLYFLDISILILIMIFFVYLPEDIDTMKDILAKDFDMDFL